MNAFLKLDRCKDCKRELSWEWVPPVTLVGRALAGTGVWRSTLTEDRCPACWQIYDEAIHRQAKTRLLRDRFIAAVGEVPYRNFTFGHFRVHGGNRFAVNQARAFNPRQTNLYLWGVSGVGKTHLAVAVLRKWFAAGTGVFLTCTQLIRKLRMRPPEDEQRVLDDCANALVLVLDDLTAGGESTAFFRRILNEIVDRRRYRGVGGLVVTSGESLARYGRSAADQATASRLKASCTDCEVRAHG